MLLAPLLFDGCNLLCNLRLSRYGIIGRNTGSRSGFLPCHHLGHHGVYGALVAILYGALVFQPQVDALLCCCACGLRDGLEAGYDRRVVRAEPAGDPILEPVLIQRVRVDGGGVGLHPLPRRLHRLGRGTERFPQTFGLSSCQGPLRRP